MEGTVGEPLVPGGPWVEEGQGVEVGGFCGGMGVLKSGLVSHTAPSRHPQALHTTGPSVNNVSYFNATSCFHIPLCITSLGLSLKIDFQYIQLFKSVYHNVLLSIGLNQAHITIQKVLKAHLNP